MAPPEFFCSIPMQNTTTNIYAGQSLAVQLPNETAPKLHLTSGYITIIRQKTTLLKGDMQRFFTKLTKK